SPFRNLLSTNKMPSNSDIKLIRSYIDVIEAEMDEIDERMSLTRAALRQAKVDKLRLQNIVAIHTAFVAPIRKLPYDILAEIFKWTIETAPDGRPSTQIDCIYASEPWSLGHVCRYWREVSRSCPFLWSQISLPYHNLIASSTIQNRDIQILKHFLDRSGAVPLSI
ncbi:uncharacterized protein EV420DRAFT_1255054, partial [Desarmillaria tabescens]